MLIAVVGSVFWVFLKLMLLLVFGSVVLVLMSVIVFLLFVVRRVVAAARPSSGGSVFIVEVRVTGTRAKSSSKLQVVLSAILIIVNFELPEMADVNICNTFWGNVVTIMWFGNKNV